MLRVTTHEATGNIRSEYPDRGQRFGAVPPRHTNVEQEEIDDLAVFPANGQAIVSVGGQPNSEPGDLETKAQESADCFVVIDNEYSRQPRPRTLPRK
jgi:hypothetical protein